MYDIIILGAGISGLTIGAQLKKQGANYLIIDKGRSVGGRMATRRGDDTRFDHGAQFVSSNQVGQIPSTSWSPWVQEEEQILYANSQGMNAAAKLAAENLSILLNTRVEKIAGKTLYFENGDSVQGKKIIITFPLPQALELLKNSQITYPPNLKNVVYAKSLVALITLNDQILNFSDIKFLKNPQSSIATISNQKSKGLTKKLSLTVTMTPEFSEKYFSDPDDESLEKIVQEFTAYLSENFDISNQNSGNIINSAELKKWKYSYPLNPLFTGHLMVDEFILLTGDAFCGGDVVKVADAASKIPLWDFLTER